ncbi:restriction endonuclease subunit S [Parolsenella sp. LCP21S3_E11]|uniref:restriction endonuclease subunit S n=1 Tax=Parolsenella sp. LCP21S3_E11 TaxID=3438797 RepID=UPI003F97EF32
MKLGDICKIKYGKDHKKLNDGSIPVYGSGGVMRHVDKALWDKPSVLIPRKGTLGNLFFADEPFWTVDTLFWTDIDVAQVVPKYLFYQLKTKDLASLNVGTAVPSLTAEVLNEVQIDLPPFEEQEQVVEVLNTLDAKIATSTKLNGYLEELADGMFRRHFGELTDNATLADFANVTMGQSPAGSSYNEAGIGTIFYQGRAEFGWRYPTQRLSTTEPKRMAKAGDVLMSVRAPVGDLNLAYEDCCIGRGLAAIHCDYPSYGLYLMRSLHKKLDAYNGEGTVFGSINGKALNGLPIALPNNAAIRAFEKEAAPIDTQIRNNEVESRALVALRGTLLPRLMAGEIDVSKVNLTQLNSHLA